jgi:hypothetical protein
MDQMNGRHRNLELRGVLQGEQPGTSGQNYLRFGYVVETEHVATDFYS